MMDIRSIFKRGIDKEQEQRAKQYEDKKGNLRGGNTGYVVDGKIYGQCARKAVMRYHEVEAPISEHTRVMFAAGEKMEDILLDKFRAAGENVKTQDECPVVWECKSENGVVYPVTGSPDVVFCDDKDKPKLGIECKMVSSYWTMCDVSPWGPKGGMPKVDHLAQAAHYAGKLGQMHGEDFIEWAIVYMQPVHMHVHTPAVRNTKFYHERINRNDRGDAFRIESGLLVYYLTFDTDGRLYYRYEGAKDYSPTPITLKGIEEYYQLVATAIDNNELPARYRNTDVTGKPLSWNPYSKKYNSFYDLHDKYDKGEIDFQMFLDLARAR